jgi:DNA-binding CsgD family transcriptional regulator
MKQLGRAILLLILIIGSTCNAQNINDLKNKITTNSRLFKTNIDKAYIELNPLLKEAQQLKDSLSELKILDRKCRYFYNKNTLDSLIISSEKLQKKSSEYHSSYYEAMSNIYMAETYSINKFHDKAIKYLSSAYELLQKENPKSEKIFYAKANVLNSFANIYLDKNEPKNAAKKIFEEIQSGNEIKNLEERNRFQYLNYSNLANIYAQLNIDSAYHYAKKSILLKAKNTPDDQSMITNYSVLGNYYKKNQDYKNAILHFHKALFINKNNGTELNMSEVYKPLLDIYQELGMKDSTAFYQNKIKEYDLQILNSKYNSLQEVINRDQKEDKKSSKNYTIWILISLGFLGGITYYFIRRKVKNKQELQNTDPILPEAYHHLIDLLEKKDPAFMFAFEKVYPKFRENLLAKNTDLQQSEIEFCALLKMQLTTKEIAKHTFIEPRTVQNKKYRLRKKFEIPSNLDIYIWINQF